MAGSSKSSFPDLRKQFLTMKPFLQIVPAENIQQESIMLYICRNQCCSISDQSAKSCHVKHMQISAGCTGFSIKSGDPD